MKSGYPCSRIKSYATVSGQQDGKGGIAGVEERRSERGKRERLEQESTHENT
jgi:hypothetical protein